MFPPPLRGLYAITPDEQNSLARLLTPVEAVLAGGCRWLQYRDKTSSPAQRHERALALLARCRAWGAGLIINDDPYLAQAIGADGVHVGREDASLAQARALLGPHAVLGVSCYADLNAASQAALAGASYVAFGACFPSLTKPQAQRVPLDVLRQFRHHSPATPICAIGGITLERAALLTGAGADLLAVVSDVFDAPDPQARSAAYQSFFEDVCYEHPQSKPV